MIQTAFDRECERNSIYFYFQHGINLEKNLDVSIKEFEYIYIFSIKSL